MAFRFMIISALAAITRASDGSFSLYEISNPTTGDIKNRHERRVRNSFIGQYSSILDIDRAKRIVDYELNPPTGFNTVEKDPADGLQTPPAITNSIATGGIENSLVNSAVTVPLGALSVPDVPTTPTLVNQLAQVGSLANLIRSFAGGFPPRANLDLASRTIFYANYNRYPVHDSRNTGVGYFGFGADRFVGAVGHSIEAPLPGSVEPVYLLIPEYL